MSSVVNELIATGYSGVPAVDNLLKQYYDYTASIYGPFWLSEKYPHVIPVVTVVLYVLMVKQLPKLMLKFEATKKGINPGFLMPLWNLFLCVWSLFMALGIGLPYIRFLIREGDFLKAVCDERKGLYEVNTMGFWAHHFVVSKYFELIDTLFLVLKHPERKVPLLHWYHHTTVLLFTWYADLYQYTGAIFMLVNATIHTFMYWYYFRKETGHNPSWALPLTIGQISQMFIGIYVNGAWMYMRWVQKKACPCREPEIITIACALMYASYAYLFLEFFYYRYIVKKPQRATTDKPKQH